MFIVIYNNSNHSVRWQ